MAQKKRGKGSEKNSRDLVLLKDLAPRNEVKGGQAKLRFGEAPPTSEGKAKP